MEGPPYKETQGISHSVEEDPEDILHDALDTMFDLKPINVGSPESSYTYEYQGIAGSHCYRPTAITLQTPDTLAANWELHASAIWVSAIYLADHIARVNLPAHCHFSSSPTAPLRILELGASAGLPSILTAKLFKNVSVTATDYPDERLISALSHNIEINNVTENCRAIPHGWGSDVSNLLENGADGFDVIFAADTLWNSDLHGMFGASIAKTLRRCPHARVVIVAGLHTGRYTIQSFLRVAVSLGLDIEVINELEVSEGTTREWDVDRGEMDDVERRRWVVWALLRWRLPDLHEAGEQLGQCTAGRN